MQDKIYNYFRINPNLHILFIFDENGLIQEDLSDEGWEEGFHYEVFDGLWFNTKYRLEHELQDKKVILLFLQKNPLDKNVQSQDFPLMDLLVANQVFSSEDTDAFMQEHHIHASFRDYVKRNLAKLQTKKIWDILNPWVENGGFSSDIANRALISSELGTATLLEWNNIIIRMTELSADGAEDKKNKFFAALANNPEADSTKAIQKLFIEIFGERLDFAAEEPLQRIAMKWKHSLITQGLELNNIDSNGLRINVDADRYEANGLRIREVNKLKRICVLQDMVDNLKAQEAETFSNAYRKLSAQIEEKAIIAAYGINAAYAYITDELCWRILADIFNDKFGSDYAAARARLDEISGKRSYSGVLASVIHYAQIVASFYLKSNQLGTAKLNTPNEYIDKYLKDLYLIDRYYRLSLETIETISNCPIYNSIIAVRNKLEESYKDIEHQFNHEWVRCLKEVGKDVHSIMLPKQDELYQQWIGTPNKQVVIISDALRYEVADELVTELATLRHKANLTAALAMLPTETKYCKPSLLPHSSLSLSLDGTPDLMVDGAVLNTSDKRNAQLLKYSPNSVLIDYKDYMAKKSTLSREDMRSFFKQYQVIYIMHDTIDLAGHNGKVISACRQTINELKQLVSELHSTYQISYVTVTSDHGFLYREMEFKGYDKQRTEEVKGSLENKSRYYLTKDAAEEQGFTKFCLADVSNISNNDIYIAVPNGSNRIYAQGDDYHFAHGGASLQEMIIPVIQSHKEHDNTKKPVNFTVIGTGKLEMVSSCLKFSIFQDEAIDMTHQSRTLKFGLFDGANPVSEMKTVVLDSADAIDVSNRHFKQELTLNTSNAGNVLKLRIYEDNDLVNPIEEHNVTNNTLIEMDF